MADMTIQEWHDKQFLPWKQAVAAYMDDRGQMEKALLRNLGQLETVLAMLLDGRTKQAMMVWNALKLRPVLTDLRLVEHGDVLEMTNERGKVVRLALDDLVADLQRMLEERDAGQV